MSEKTQGDYITRIPTLGDDAEINTAFKFYHYGLDPVTGSADTESIVGHFTAVNARVDASNVRITATENSIINLQQTIGPSLSGTYLARVSASANTNIVTPQFSNIIPLVIAGVTGQTANLQEWRDTVSGSVIAKVDTTGKLFSNNIEVVTLTSAQTVTNKTLTSPILNSATLNSPTIKTPNITVAVETTAKTTDYTFVLSDSGKLIQMSSTGATNFFIPTDATVNYDIGTQITVVRINTGAVTIGAVTPATTTVNGTPGLKLRAQWSMAVLTKRAANTWLVTGDLVA